MNTQDLLDGLRGDLYLAGMTAQSARPTGLTASAVGVCRSQAGFLLAGSVPVAEPGDLWRGMRGTAIHEFIQTHRDNGVRQFEGRVSATVAGIDVSGAFDEWDPDTHTVLDFKTRDVAVCHNPKLDDEQRFQLSIVAKGLGAKHAFVVFVPFNGGFDDWSAVEVDIEQSFAEAAVWLESVIGEPQDNLPRDKPPSWCEMFCRFYSVCRPGWVNVGEPISTPSVLIDIVEAKHAIEARKAAEKAEKAAKLRLEGIRGVAANGLEVVVTEVEPAVDDNGVIVRRGYSKLDVKKARA